MISDSDKWGSDGSARIQRHARATRNLTPLVAGQAISLLGDYVAVFTLPYFVLAITGRPLDLGITAAAETLPMLLFGLVAGVFLDRRRRLVPVLVVADVLRAVIFGILAVLALTGAATLPMVLALAFATGSLAVVFDSGLQAAMPGLLEDEMLVDANSQLGFARTAMFAAGPLVAGVAISATRGFTAAFALDSITFVASAAFLLATRPVRARAPRSPDGLVTAVRDGLRFLFAEPSLRWATLGGTVTNFVFAPLEALLIFFVATEILHTDELGFSLTGHGLHLGLYFSLQAAIGAIGVAFAPRLSRKMSLGRLYVLGLALFGLGFLVVAFWHSYWSFVFTGMAAGGVAWVNVSLSTLRQRLTPDELLGRVIATSRMIAWAGLPLGAALGGVAADHVGIVPIYVFGAATILVVSAALVPTALFRTGIREADTTEADPAPGGSLPA